MPIDSEQAVTVLGLGYIGLPTAALIARSGNKVTGVDVSQQVVDTVNNGKVHIEEVDLDGLVQGVVSRGRQNMADVGAVLLVMRRRHGDDEDVGTTEKVAALLAELRPDLNVPGACSGAADIFVAYCPERVLPGRILVELVDNDRCIGGITPRCARRAMTFYRQFVRGACVTTSARAAEMVKLVENSYRDVNIAFANELSMMAEHMGVDVWEVIRLANRHPRVNILQPGPGVGGHCIAVDPWFLVHGAPEHSRLIRTAREVNLAKTAHVIGAAEMLVSQHPKARVACLGLAFKPNIDDFRESPAVEVAAALARRFGKQIEIVEPYATGLPMEFAGTGAELIDLDSALASCDLLIVLVDHDLFKSIPLEERCDKIVYDTRGLWLDQPGGSNGNRLHRAA